MASAQKLRAKAYRMHRKAARSILWPERAKRLTLRAVNYERAARLAEREEREARRRRGEAEGQRLREHREAYAESVAHLPPTWTEEEREARIRAYDEAHGRLC